MRWLDFGLIGLLISVPDPYWFCFHKGFTWTATTKEPTHLMGLGNDNNAAAAGLDNALAQCKLNGRAELKLNEHLGEKMGPMESKTVYIDTKVLVHYFWIHLRKICLLV